jgi:hypothetical protein
MPTFTISKSKKASPDTMSRPLTFGIEIEFALAAIPKGKENPCPELEDEIRGRITNFELNEWDDRFGLMRRSVESHVAATIRAAGFPCDPYSPDMGDATKWEVTTDPTIKVPTNGLRWFGIEIRSPAYYFCSESLYAVAEVLDLLKSTYCIHIDGNSCGLHVHVGNENRNFTFQHVRNLHAFLFAFDSQISSLHPPYRQNRYWLKSPRALFHWGLGGQRPPTTKEGILRYLQATDFRQLKQLGAPHIGTSAVNFFHVFEGMGEGRETKRTVEFRQHEASLNGATVINWIKTVVGIVEYTRTIHPDAFIDLLAMSVESEDVKDEGKPILAEEGFTIVDLLRAIGQLGPARFYKDRGIFRNRPVYSVDQPYELKWDTTPGYDCIYR